MAVINTPEDDKRIESFGQEWEDHFTKHRVIDREKTERAVQWLRRHVMGKAEAPVFFARGPVEAQLMFDALTKKPSLTQEQLEQKVAKKLKPGLKLRVSMDLDVSLWTHWAAYYKYGLDYYFPEEWNEWSKEGDFKEFCDFVVKEVWGLLNTDAFSIHIDPPTTLERQSEHELHCESGPAVKFADGSGRFYLNGYEIPSWVFKKPVDSINPKRVFAIDNVDVKAEVIAFIGMDRFRSLLEMEVIEKKTVKNAEMTPWLAEKLKKFGVPEVDMEHDYTLYHVSTKEGEDLGNALEMVGPSTGKRYLEGVEGETVEAALAFRASDSEGYVAPRLLT